MWNITISEPAPIYPSVKEVNYQIRAWGMHSLLTISSTEHFTLDGQHQLLPPPRPPPGSLVETMDPQLLVGVLGNSETADELLMVIVDKRVSAKLQSLPKRRISVRLSPLVSEAEPLASPKATISRLGSLRSSMPT